MCENKLLIGFSIEAFNIKAVNAIKKNARVPILLRTLIKSEVISVNPFIVEIKLKPKFFKKSRNDATKRLVISSTENLISAIKQEMLKSECDEGIDYSLEVIRE